MKKTFPAALLFALLFAFSFCSAILAAEECAYDPDAPLRFHTDAEFIYDQYGRTAIMRGVNMPAGYRPEFPYSEQDLDNVEKFGYNLIRLVTAWSNLEPVEGQFNREHLEANRRFIRLAAARGIYTMPDIHQVQWCASHMIPDWMCNERPGHGILVEAIKKESDRFWNSPDLQAKLVRVWEFLATEYRDEPGVFAYDILNEPFSYDAISYGSFEKCCLYPFYKKTIAAIRAADPRTPIALEPPPLNVLLPAYTEDFGSGNLIWAPHAYYPHSYGPGGYSVDKEETPADARAKYKRFAREAAGMGAPLLIGEFGMCGWDRYPFMPPWLEENMKMQERLLASSAVWDYGRAAHGWGILNTEGAPNPDLAAILHRPYPRYTAGTPEKLAFDPERKTFRYRYTASPDICAPTEIYLPPELFGGGPDILVQAQCGAAWVYDQDRKTLVIPSGCAGAVEVSATAP
jgi:endoglycosylceramidase